MLYTDTDGLIVHVQTDIIYADMAQHTDQYDTSNYPADQFLHSIANKKVLRTMKDECARTPIADFVSLKPKMYSILRASGVPDFFGFCSRSRKTMPLRKHGSTHRDVNE